MNHLIIMIAPFSMIQSDDCAQSSDDSYKYLHPILLSSVINFTECKMIVGNKFKVNSKRFADHYCVVMTL